MSPIAPQAAARYGLAGMSVGVQKVLCETDDALP